MKFEMELTDDEVKTLLNELDILGNQCNERNLRYAMAGRYVAAAIGRRLKYLLATGGPQ